MSTKTILILQGGGALGAYECGAYQALVPYLDNLAVVAGTSIGAINASLIASHYQTADHGAGVLKHFWTEVLATSSYLFFPPFGVWRRWNAVWTSLLSGNPHLFTPRFWGSLPWVFRAPVYWSETHFYQTQAMEQTLQHCFEPYGPRAGDPRLIVTAVDIKAGKAQAFDSWEDRITTEHVVSSGSLPPMFPPKEVDRRFYWDGGLWSNSPLPEVLNVLQKVGPIDESYQVYIIDVFPQQGSLPQTNWEVWQRINEITYADKTNYDCKSSAWVNRYIDLVKTLHGQLHLLPSALRNQIEQEYTRISREKRVHLDIAIIQRAAFPNEQAEQISRELDFSPERIKELMSQGFRDAKQALEKKN